MVGGEKFVANDDYIYIPLEWFNPFHWLQKGTDKVENWIGQQDQEITGHLVSEVITPTLWDVWNGILLMLPDLVGYAAMGTSIILMLGGRVLKTVGIFGGFTGLSLAILSVN